MKWAHVIVFAFAATAAHAQVPTIGSDKAVAPIPRTAWSTDLSDLWWNPNESGWGLQMVQESSVIFATLFIYGDDGKPTWATATMNAVAGNAFSGALYLTTGPSFAGPFNPGGVVVRQAGTMTFTANSVQAGVLTYSIDGVQVTKQIQRQTLVLENYSGDYVVGINLQSTGCINPSQNGVLAGAIELIINHSGPNMAMLWRFNNGSTCTYSGSYDQSGHMGAFTGDFNCSSGEFGQMRLFELTNRPGMMSGRLRGGGLNTACQYTGYFSGIDPHKPPK